MIGAGDACRQHWILVGISTTSSVLSVHATSLQAQKPEEDGTGGNNPPMLGRHLIGVLTQFVDNVVDHGESPFRGLNRHAFGVGVMEKPRKGAKRVAHITEGYVCALSRMVLWMDNLPVSAPLGWRAVRG